MQRFCRVAIDSRVSALDRAFDYAIPDRLVGKIAVGSVVRVVLHGRGMRAFVTELLDEAAVPSPRSLSALVSQQPLFGPHEIELARWAARRYVVPLGVVLHDAVPGRFSAPERHGRSSDAPPRTAPPGWLRGSLSEAIAARGVVCVVPPSSTDEPALAAHVAGEAAAAGGQTLIICPLIDHAQAVAASIAGAVVLHGDERPGERAAAWAGARDGDVGVIVGGRSALFVPMPELAAVCVLSAHDRSLKSERAPRVHALVVARERARVTGAAFIGSSAAPPVEFAGSDGVQWIEGARTNVRPEIARPRGGPVTPRLLEIVRATVAGGEDVLVFVGRRGNALRLRCTDCGWTPACAQCGAGLAEGNNPGRLHCRVCGNETAAPTVCAACGGALAERGWGHERVARAVERADVGAPVIRVVRGAVPDSRPFPAVWVGTMAAVHAIGQAGAVCVADLDQLLARPDFRAAEHALQTLHELAAVLRPGGRFLVQTREPDHHTVQAFTRRSYRFFFDREIAFRKQTTYPPFGAIVRVELGAGDLDDLTRVVRGSADVIGTVARGGRLVALIRASDLEPVLDPLRRFSAEHPRTKIDVDPVDVV